MVMDIQLDQNDAASHAIFFNFHRASPATPPERDRDFTTVDTNFFDLYLP